MSPLHHIALGARDVAGIADFYREAFELDELTRHFDDDAALRSVWLDLETSILMIERTDRSRPRVDGVDAGPFLLAFSVAPEERWELEVRLRQLGSTIEDRSRYTSYARDPEGNRIAVSHFPHPPVGRATEACDSR